MKKLKDEVIDQKECKLLFNFKVKAEESTNEIIKIEGWASFCGDMADENSMFIDHTQEVIDPKGMDVSFLRKNPVLLWQHNRLKVIGEITTIQKKKEGLWISANVHTATMEPEDAYAVANHLVRQFSVGVRYLKVESKTINDKEVYIATKSRVMEVSIVTIACNAASEWSIVKSYDNDTFGANKENFSDTTDNDTQIHKSEDGDTMKIKIADKYSATEIEKMVKLGLISDAEAEIEVNTKEYIDLLVMEKFETFKADFKAELKAEADAITKAAEEKLALEKKEAEDKAKTELAEKLSITVEDLEKMTDEEIETKVKALEDTNEEEEFTADDLLALKELAASQNEYLKSFIDEEK